MCGGGGGEGGGGGGGGGGLVEGGAHWTIGSELRFGL